MTFIQILLYTRRHSFQLSLAMKRYSFWSLSYVQLVSFITAVIHHSCDTSKYSVHSTSPLFNPNPLTWRPPAVTESPPWFQVARKLSLQSPVVPAHPPPFHLPPLSGFSPEPNVLLIRTHPKPLPSEQNTHVCICITGFRYLGQISSPDMCATSKREFVKV